VGHSSRQTVILSLSFSLPVTLLLYLTGGTLQQTGMNTLSPSCHSSPTVSHWWDTAADRQEVSFSFPVTLLLYLTGRTLQQTGRNTLSSLSLVSCILLVGHCSRQTGILSPPCHSSPVSYWWDTAADRQEYSLSFSLPVTHLLYLTGGTLQQTGRNTLSPPCHSSTVSHWWDTAADRQEYSLYLSFSSLSLIYCISFVEHCSRQAGILSILPVTHLLYLTGGTLQQTGRNTFYPPCHSSTVSHWWDTAADRQEYSFSPSCHSPTVSHWWDTAADRQEYFLSCLSFFSYCISLVGHYSREAGILYLLPVILLLLYLIGGTLLQTGRNIFSSLCHSPTISVLGTLQQTGIVVSVSTFVCKLVLFQCRSLPCRY
jgi:hypothetical protein